MSLQRAYARLTPAERVEVAARCGISAKYLWQIAHRWRGRAPSLPLMYRLADALPGVTVAGLVKEFAPEPQAVE